MKLNRGDLIRVAVQHPTHGSRVILYREGRYLKRDEHNRIVYLDDLENERQCYEDEIATVIKTAHDT